MSIDGNYRGPDGRPIDNRRDARVMTTQDKHRARHVVLHNALDELLADYLLHHRGSLPSKITLMQLLKWSHEQMIEPTSLDDEREHPEVL